MKKQIPSCLSLGNLFSGILSILLSLTGHIGAAAALVLTGMVFDLFDGFAARKLHAESQFGRDLDSLCDVVTFGAAPALLIYNVILHRLPIAGIILAGLFTICGALRLARFNIQTEKKPGFVGMPITFAGGLLSVFSLFSAKLDMNLSVIMVALLSFLMISRLHFPSLKKWLS
ncbi:CDP-diacylglycerol--glycerol-3-phosphate 3-phosphatidyltransferase [compost metagenome]